MVSHTNPSFSPEHIRFLSYIKAVGTGPKGNRPLTKEETKDAFSLILERRISDPLISAFLLGWRVQGESNEELSGCVEYLFEQQDSPLREASDTIEIGYPMDGKIKFPFLMLASAKYLNTLTVHTVNDEPLGPKYGITCDRFSYTPNVHIHHRQDLISGLSNLTDLRNSIGIRTAFNTLEKLNFLAPVGLIGMHHAPYFDLYASLYAPYYQRLVIVQGHEGTPEILKNTKYKIVENGEITTHHIDPQDFGIEPIAAKEEMDLDAMKKCIENPDENLTKMIQLNAAFIGFIAGKFETIEKGMMCLQD
jgi:anthranilate phosphoribosyltransferase